MFDYAYLLYRMSHSKKQTHTFLTQQELIVSQISRYRKDSSSTFLVSYFTFYTDKGSHGVVLPRSRLNSVYSKRLVSNEYKTYLFSV